MHDASKCLMGVSQSSDKVVTSDFAAVTANFPAGTFCRLKSDNTLSKTLADGSLIGVSMGKSLSDTERVALAKFGLKIPVLLEDRTVQASLVVQDLTYTAVPIGEAGNDITIEYEDTLSDGTASVVVEGNAIVVSIESGVTTASAIADAIEADASDLVTVEIADGEDTTAQVTAAEDALEGGLDAYNYVVVGELVYVNDSTGKATDVADDSTVSKAKYVSGALTGIAEDGTEVGAALIEFSSGL